MIASVPLFSRWSGDQLSGVRPTRHRSLVGRGQRAPPMPPATFDGRQRTPPTPSPRGCVCVVFGVTLFVGVVTAFLEAPLARQTWDAAWVMG